MAQTVDLAYEPVPLQGAAAPGYDAIDLRRAAIARGATQEGVVGPGDFKVTQNTGANRLMNIAAGEFFAQGDDVTGQGAYYGRSDAAIDGQLDVTVADVSNPRLDQIVLEVKDNQHDLSGLNKARLRVVTGTATAGATLDNRSGAAALPNTCIRLADVLVPAGGNVTNANIRDRRPWARGAYCVVESTGNAAVTTTAAELASALVKRLEISAGLVEVTLQGRLSKDATAGSVTLQPKVDAAAQTKYEWNHDFVASEDFPVQFTVPVAIAAGSHTLGWLIIASAGGGTMFGSNAPDFFATYREVVTPSASND